MNSRSWTRFLLDITGGTATKKGGSGLAAGSAVYGLLTGDYVGGGLGFLAGLGLRGHETVDNVAKGLHSAARVLLFPNPSQEEPPRKVEVRTPDVPEKAPHALVGGMHAALPTLASLLPEGLSSGVTDRLEHIKHRKSVGLELKGGDIVLNDLCAALGLQT